MTFEIVFALLVKSVLAGLVGSLDSVCILVTGRKSLSQWRYIVMFAGISGLIHLAMKTFAGLVVGESNHQFAVVVRIIAFASAIAVVAISGHEVLNLDRHLDDPSVSHADEEWDPSMIHSWIPAALIGSIDAYPIGSFKAFTFATGDPVKLFVGYLFGALALTGFILLSAKIVLDWEHRYHEYHHRVIATARMLHIGVFLSLSQYLGLEIWAMMVKSKVSSGLLWLVFVSTIVVLRYRYFPHIRRWLRFHERHEG